MPKRLPVLWAKVGVYAAVSFVLMLPSVLIAFFASQAILTGTTSSRSPSRPTACAPVIGGALYLMVIGVFALALGAIIRNTAGGISAFAGIMFVIPPLMNVLPTSWNNAISPYLPSSAGRRVFALTHGSDSLAPWPGFALFCGYAALTIAIAAVLLLRRDTWSVRRWLRRIGLAILGLLLAITLAAIGFDLATAGDSRPATALYKGPFVRVGKTLVAYRQWGTSGTPIVLLGGAAEPSWVWHEVGPRLAARHHIVYAIDLPPFGYTERRGPYTLAGWVALLHGFEQHLGIHRPLIVGH